jgi:hypothetical protein
MITPRGKNGNALPQRLSMQSLFFRLLCENESPTIFQEPTIALFTFYPSRQARIQRLMVMAILRSCATSTPRQIHLA